MKKSLLGILAVSFALILCLCSCDKVIEMPLGVPDATPGSSTGPESSPAPTSSGTADPAAGMAELLTETVMGDLLPAADPETELSPELAAEYREQYPEKQSARAVFLETYAQLVTVTVGPSTDETAQVTFDTPDLASILTAAAEQAGEDTSAADLEKAMTDILLSGGYPTRSAGCTLALSRGRDGSLTVEKTPEYWDGIYGGLLSLSQELLEELEG